MLQTSLLCNFLILLIQLTTITESKQSIACAGSSTCKVHKLICKETKYINITSGSYGYKTGCSTQITDNNCPETGRCCTETTGGETPDCFLAITISSFQGKCLDESTCDFGGQTNSNNTTCKLNNRVHAINSYSKIKYRCVNRGSIRKWIPTSSTGTSTMKGSINRGSHTGTTSTETTTASTDGGDNTGGTIGAVVATIVVVAIILVVVIVIMKRKKKQSAQENPLNERKGSTVPIINNIAGERETTGYSEVDLGDMSTSQTKSPSSNTDIPNQVTEPTTYAEYNHLGDNNSVKTKPSNANYNQIQINKSGEDNYQHFQNPGKPKPQTDAEYNHIGAVNKMLDEGDYNSLGNISKPDVVDNDNYSHIGGIQRDVPNSDYDLSNYSHIGEVQRDVANNVPDLGGAGIQDGQQGPSNVRRNDYAQVNKKRK